MHAFHHRQLRLFDFTGHLSRPTPHAAGRKLVLFFRLDLAFIRSKSQDAND